jgi:hypothetical protein
MMRISREDPRIVDMGVFDARATTPIVGAGEDQWWSQVSIEKGGHKESATGQEGDSMMAQSEPTMQGPTTAHEETMTVSRWKGKERAVDQPENDRGEGAEGAIGGLGVGQAASADKRKAEGGLKGKGKPREEEELGSKTRKRRRASSVATTVGGEGEDENCPTKRGRAKSVTGTVGGEDEDRPAKKIRGAKDQVVHQLPGATVRHLQHDLL